MRLCTQATQYIPMPHPTRHSPRLLSCSCALCEVKLHMLLLLSAVQVIFKQLLSLKWAERDLGLAWQSMRATKRLTGYVQNLYLNAVLGIATDAAAPLLVLHAMCMLGRAGLQRTCVPTLHVPPLAPTHDAQRSPHHSNLQPDLRTHYCCC